jgi:hypothetical protein
MSEHAPVPPGRAEQITGILNLFPEVVWDRCAGDATAFIGVFGWIARADRKQDFIYLLFDPEKVFLFSTSSARFSEEFSKRLGFPSPHSPCRRVENDFPSVLRHSPKPKTVKGGEQLWQFFHDEHGLLLLESELHDVIHAVKAHLRTTSTPPLSGTLIFAGDLMVNGEEITGVALVCDRETLATAKALPLYQDCAIIPLSEATEPAEHSEDKTKLAYAESNLAILAKSIKREGMTWCHVVNEAVRMIQAAEKPANPQPVFHAARAAVSLPELMKKTCDGSTPPAILEVRRDSTNLLLAIVILLQLILLALHFTL